ncbi:unnamed protein product, partial [Ilex paraguariensis]
MRFLKSTQKDRECVLPPCGGTFNRMMRIQNRATSKSNGVDSGHLQWISERHYLIFEFENMNVAVAIFTEGASSLDFVCKYLIEFVSMLGGYRQLESGRWKSGGCAT